MKRQRAKLWRSWFHRGALCLVSTACGRSEIVTDSDIRGLTSGGQSNRGSSMTTTGGSSLGQAQTGGLGGGFVSCPQEIPVEGSICASNLACAYVSVDKGCCQETASARCKSGQWTIAYTDCDGFAAGGSGSGGGSAATGGLVSSGGLTAIGGSSGTAGALGCRGDSIAAPPVSCDLLIPADPPLVRLAGVTVATSNPMGLARATDDGRCVSVATTQSGSGSEEVRLLGVSFEPWSNWPKGGSLGPLKTIERPASGARGLFVLGPSRDHKVALAYSSTSGETGFGWDLDPETFVGTYHYLSSASPPLIISTSQIGQLLASQGTLQQSMRVWSQDEHAYVMFPGACADTATNVGVEPYQQGFLFAASNGVNNTAGACYYSTSTPGAATRIEIGQITDVCCSHSIWNFELGTTITALKTAPHPNGIWVVWQAEDAGTREFRWMRIGFKPGIVLGPASVDFDGDAPRDFAVTAIERKLVVAWRNEAAEPRLAVALIDETGRVSRSDPAVQVPDLRQLTMVSGPAGSGALIGFPDGNLMRLDCAQWE